jgi:hypothetical protein
MSELILAPPFCEAPSEIYLDTPVCPIFWLC